MPLPLLLSLLLGPPQTIEGGIVLRVESSLRVQLSLRPVLEACAAPRRLAALPQVELRIVPQPWLQKAFGAPKRGRRMGHYLPATPKQPAILYAADGPQLLTTVAREWLHHLDAAAGRTRDEDEVEVAAKRCAVP